MLCFAVGTCLSAGCGEFSSSAGGDCSGGSLSGNTCIPDPPVHWTDAKATAAAAAFSYAPMVQGRLKQAHCRIVARFEFSEAESLCTAVFSAPGTQPRRVVLAFSLSGRGAVNPDCRHHWKSSPFCSGRGQAIYSGSG